MESISTARNHIFKARVLVIFLVYGFVIGIYSYSMGYKNDFALLLNYPGMGLTHFILSMTPPDYYEVRPEMYLPFSILAWGLIGLAITLLQIVAKRAKSTA